MGEPEIPAFLRRRPDAPKQPQKVYKADMEGIDLSGADLIGADFANTNLTDANLTDANLTGANLIGANLIGADLIRANLTNANLTDANLTGSDLTEANLTGADLTRTYLAITDLTAVDFTMVDFTRANLTDIRKGTYGLTRKRHISYRRFPHALKNSSSSPDTISKPKKTPPLRRFDPGLLDAFNLVVTVGSNFLVTAATLASVIQGFDIIERRWRERQEKDHHRATQPTPAQRSTQETEITEIRLVMDDGSQHSFMRWLSDPDSLRTYIDAFSDPTSKVKPLQVVFVKRDALRLVVDVTSDGKDNRQLNVILSYLESDLQ